MTKRNVKLISSNEVGGIYYAVLDSAGVLIWKRFVQFGNTKEARAAGCGGTAFAEAVREQEKVAHDFATGVDLRYACDRKDEP